MQVPQDFILQMQDILKDEIPDFLLTLDEKSPVSVRLNNKLKLIVDPELDVYSEDAWYLAASPYDCDTIEVTYLNGSETPTLESNIPFDNLGMKWRIYMDYGVTAIDYRGLYKNAGK